MCTCKKRSPVPGEMQLVLPPRAPRAHPYCSNRLPKSQNKKPRRKKPSQNGAQNAATCAPHLLSPLAFSENATRKHIGARAACAARARAARAPLSFDYFIPRFPPQQIVKIMLSFVPPFNTITCDMPRLPKCITKHARAIHEKNGMSNEGGPRRCNCFHSSAG